MTVRLVTPLKLTKNSGDGCLKYLKRWSCPACVFFSRQNTLLGCRSAIYNLFGSPTVHLIEPKRPLEQSYLWQILQRGASEFAAGFRWRSIKCSLQGVAHPRSRAYLPILCFMIHSCQEFVWRMPVTRRFTILISLIYMNANQ